jgi:hypothetical protein
MALFGKLALIQCLCVIVSICTFVVVTDAFTIHRSSGEYRIGSATEKSIQWSAPCTASSTICRLSANTDEGTEQEASATEEETSNAPEVPDDAVSEITAAPEPEAAPKVEDPAITSLKEEIAKLELDVRSSRRQLANINDEAEEFTKTGYARKVAEMENMRRARSVSTLIRTPRSWRFDAVAHSHVAMLHLYFLDVTIDE